jgi:hypothetical protein
MLESARPSMRHFDPPEDFAKKKLRPQFQGPLDSKSQGSVIPGFEFTSIDL